MTIYAIDDRVQLWYQSQPEFMGPGAVTKVMTKIAPQTEPIQLLDVKLDNGCHLMDTDAVFFLLEAEARLLIRGTFFAGRVAGRGIIFMGKEN